MIKNKETFTNIDEYIEMFPADVQKKLQELRKVIKETAPEAKETISYKMPAFKQNGPLVYFAGYKNHIGFYPVPSGIAAFKEELSKFKSSKGSVQFPLDQPLPIDLVKRIVKFRVKEDFAKGKK